MFFISISKNPSLLLALHMKNKKDESNYVYMLHPLALTSTVERKNKNNSTWQFSECRLSLSHCWLISASEGVRHVHYQEILQFSVSNDRVRLIHPLIVSMMFKVMKIFFRMKHRVVFYCSWHSIDFPHIWLMHIPSWMILLNVYWSSSMNYVHKWSKLVEEIVKNFDNSFKIVVFN
jgi:hypothetical protein